GAGVRLRPHVLVGDADGEVVAAVAVEVPRGEGRAEVVTELALAGEAAGPLHPELALLGGEARGGAEEHDGGAGVVVLAENTDGEVVVAVAVEVPHGDGEAEAVSFLRGAWDVAGLLRPELAAGGGEAGSRAVDHVDGASVPGDAVVLEGDAGGEVVVAVAVEVPGGEPAAEFVAELGRAGGAGRVLRPQLAAVGGKAGTRAVEDDGRAGVVLPVHRLVGDADGEVVEPVAVEVPRGEGDAEVVEGLGGAGPGRGLGPRLGAGGGEAGGRAVDHLHGPAVLDSARVLAGDADGEVVEPVAVEVPRREGVAEDVACFSGLAGEVILSPELVAIAAEAAGAAVEHVDDAGVSRRAHVLEGDADGEVGVAVGVEVGRREGEAELIARPRGAVDAGCGLAPERVARGGATRGAVEGDHAAGVRRPARVVADDAHGEVVEAVVAEVAR